jgi:hypothetical protein
MLSGGSGRVTGDGTEAVGFGGFLKGFDNGATLGAGRADDGEQGAEESCVIVMVSEMRGAMLSRPRGSCETIWINVSLYHAAALQIYLGLINDPRASEPSTIHPMTTVNHQAGDD